MDQWPRNHRDLKANVPPQILGIVNITEDSFSDGGRFLAPEQAIAQAVALVEAPNELFARHLRRCFCGGWCLWSDGCGGRFESGSRCGIVH